MLWRNWVQVLQICLVPTCVLICAGFAFPFEQPTPGLQPEYGAGQVIRLGLTGFIGIWIAVVWHRFVLNESYPEGWLPKLNLDRMLSYLGYTLAILMLCPLAAGLVQTMPRMLLGASYELLAGGELSFAMFMVGVFIFLLLMLRLSLTLVAVSIGESLKIRESWEATKEHQTDIVVLALCYAAFEYAVWRIPKVSEAEPVLSVLLEIVQVLVFSSIVTTLYGIYVEERTLG